MVYANGLNHTLDMSDLPKGLYIVRLSSTNLNIVKTYCEIMSLML